MEEFNHARQWAKVVAGLKGGPFNANPITPPPMTFVDGYPSETNQVYQEAKNFRQGNVLDVWNMRRPAGGGI